MRCDDLEEQRKAEDDSDGQERDRDGPEHDDVRRPKASAERRPMAVDTMDVNSTLNVLTLIPPAVDPDAPPMNIRAMPMKRPASVRPPGSIAAKPAVR